MTIRTGTYHTSEILFESRAERFQLVHEERHTGEALSSSASPVQLSPSKEFLSESGIARPYMTSFFVPTEAPKRRTYVVVPELEGISMHSSALTSKARDLLHTFWAIVASKALQGSFTVKKATIGIFRDPTEDRQQVVLRLFVEASATQVVAFWDSLESDIKEWLAELHESDRLTFLKDISMRIHWQ